MPRLKRNAAEAELDALGIRESMNDSPASEMLSKLRNMWEFASLMQYIYMFGSVVKIDENFDIEDLEEECLKQEPSEVLPAVGLALLKYVSSHRGLTPGIFAEYTRRQYLAKLPTENPFGDEEEPIPFNDLDIYTRVRVLQQLSIWTFTNAERIRGMMPEDEDHLGWRIEPLGWDSEDTSYFVLDDNRLYRRKDIPLPPTPVKSKSKLAKKKKKPAPKPTRGTRASKRRKIGDSPEVEEDEEMEDAVEDTTIVDDNIEEDGYGITSKTWELVAITLEEYQEFLATIQKTRDPNEKQLRRRIEESVLPIIEKRAEAIRQKHLKKLRELENIEKMATAKRSSRLADKADKAAKEEEERQAELKKQAELRMAHEEQDRQRRIEEGHESRRLTREQRLKEREVKRILHEEELARLDGEASSTHDDIDEGAAERKRLSSRNLQNQQEAHRKELEQLAHDQQEDKWYFDCVVCGRHGENFDDGSHSVACERCNVWQHSGCHNLTPQQCEDPDFHFVCRSCRRKEKAAKDQKSGIVLKLGKAGSPKSEANDTILVAPKREHGLPDYVQQQLNGTAQAPSSMSAPHYAAYPYPNPSYQVGAPQSIPHGQLSQALGPSGPHLAVPARSADSPSHLTGQVAHPHNAPSAGTPSQLSGQSIQPYLPPPQNQSPVPYPNRGFAGTPPQRTQQVPQPGRAAVPPMSQHNWVHYNAVNGSLPQMATMQQNITRPQPPPPAPMQPRTPAPSSQSPHADQIQRSPLNLLNGAPHLQRSPDQKVQRTPQAQHSPAVSSALPSSPHTSFPPPTNEYNRQAAISPTKSSPPRPIQASPHANGHAPTPAASFLATASPAASFEHAPKLATPSKTVDVSVSPSQNVSNVATNGMKGPWPEQSLSVPHKSDASPAR